MTEEHFARLTEAAENGETMSIAINGDGHPVRGGFVPWEKTAHAYNMKKPKLTVSRDDLRNAAVMDVLRRCRLVGCYIFDPLEDYGFLADFSDVQDLFILHAGAMRDLSFLRSFTGLSMFYLHDARIPDLRPLAEALAGQKSAGGICLGFSDCRIGDVSALTAAGLMLSELLVWPAEGDLRERWAAVPHVLCFRYYR